MKTAEKIAVDNPSENSESKVKHPYVPTKEEIKDWEKAVIEHMKRMSTDEEYCKSVEDKLYGRNI